MTKLNLFELDNRAHEVFLLDEGEIVYNVEGDTQHTIIKIVNTDNFQDFDYLPDMSSRPEALDYLLGKRNDFND